MSTIPRLARLKRLSSQTTFLFLAIAVLSACTKPEGFVSLDGRQFKLDGEDFYPVMLNYVVDFVDTEQGPALSPTYTYEDQHGYEYLDMDSLNLQIGTHMALMRELGFNTIRLCFDRITLDSAGHYFHSLQDDRYYLKEDREALLDLLQNFIDLASAEQMKVMLLIKSPYHDEQLADFTKAVLKRFANEPTLFAYDFFNEPLYFAPQEMRKNDAYHIVWEWKRWMMKYAPHQLLTIGFSEPIEVFRWDPSIMPVDFIAFHTYHPLRIPNEIYWYANFVDKPWMLGETSLPANNDSISYEAQRQFMKEVFRKVKACGGSGFAWWEFQDEPGLIYDAAYNGLLDNNGTTSVKGKTHTIQGSIKPAAHELKMLIEEEVNAPCTCAVNYHNMLGYVNRKITGRVVEYKSGKPIEGALVRGWTEWWDIGKNTFTDSDGYYSLYSNAECVHFEISAPGKTMSKFDAQFSYTPSSEQTPALDDLPEQRLEYHSIHFQPFLMADSIPDSIEADHFIFNFDPEKFSKAHYEADGGVHRLRDFKPKRSKLWPMR